MTSFVSVAFAATGLAWMVCSVAAADGCLANGTCANEGVWAEPEENTCTIYLAPSSLKGVNGFGIFSTKSFKKDSMVLPADAPDIPVVDVPYDSDDPITARWVSHFDTYWWGAGKGTSDEATSEADVVQDFAPSFGSLLNYHPLLHNMESRIPTTPYNDNLVNRSTSPGIGAFSYHMGRDFMAGSDVDAGDELFLQYGVSERYEKYEAYAWLKYVPREKDYRTAGNIMKKSWKSLQAVRDMVNDRDLEERIIEQMLSNIRIMSQHKDSRVVSLLPTTLAELIRIDEKSKGKMPALSRALAKEMTLEKRSVDWIKQHGRCLDNIVPGPSTLAHAGRGAIAQRQISAGDVIVPLPLLQIMDWTSLTVYTDERTDRGTMHGASFQLLLNYCFGHHESTLLLCPLTNGLLMNHCSTRTKECGEGGPNAEYRWDTNWDLHTKRWLNMTLEEMAKDFDKGLAFEVIASRVIKKGEEIFIDYGIGWEDAWKRHIAEWKPPTGDRSFSVAKLNEEQGPVEILSGSLREKSDHPSMYTGCLFSDYFDEDSVDYKKLFGLDEDDKDWDEDASTIVQWRYNANNEKDYRPLSWEVAIDEYFNDLDMSPPDELWKKLSDDEILWRYAQDGSRFVSNLLGQGLGDGSHWPCTVVDQESEDKYIVRIFQSDLHEPTMWEEAHKPMFLTSYPRESIRYFIKPYKSDVHLPSAFRHPIEIHDEIFPAHWKNFKSVDTDP